MELEHQIYMPTVTLCIANMDNVTNLASDFVVPIGFSSAFATHDSHSVDTLGEKFDYRSIMMYDEYAFSKDGVSPTLQAKENGVVIGPIWKKHRLSQSDIRRIHKLYKCNGNKPKPGFPSNVKCNFNSHTCGFKNGGSAVWNWRNVTDKDGYVYNSYETAGGAPGYFLSTNFHPLSKDDPRGPMGCVRFWYLLQGNGEPYLKKYPAFVLQPTTYDLWENDTVKKRSGSTWSDIRTLTLLQLSQAYLDKSTQLFYNPDMTYDLWENDTETEEWIHVELPLYVTRPFKLIFISGFNNTSTSGTIGLDDVELLYTPCSFSTTTAHQTMSPLATSKIPSPSTTKKNPHNALDRHQDHDTGPTDYDDAQDAREDEHPETQFDGLGDLCQTHGDRQRDKT
uniref:Uncharacterized protein n=1 Tax=Timema cristinae TaxID=61476 RepID=A0A7R9D169_TIMCR|nr:unnamed protein product [Timema cristinae]